MRKDGKVTYRFRPLGRERERVTLSQLVFPLLRSFNLCFCFEWTSKERYGGLGEEDTSGMVTPKWREGRP